MQGEIEKLFPSGYGFIRSPDGQQFFFHAGDVAAARFDDLALGTIVKFTVEQAARGPKARRVTVVGGGEGEDDGEAAMPWRRAA